MSLDLVIVGEEAWTREEWEAERRRRENGRQKRNTPARRAYMRMYQQTPQRRAYKRAWAQRKRGNPGELIGSLHDLRCAGPTKATGCTCHKIRCYDKPR